MTRTMMIALGLATLAGCATDTDSSPGDDVSVGRDHGGGSFGGGCHDCDSPAIAINEIEASGGAPADWIELRNLGDAAADLSGWAVVHDGGAYTLPAGTAIAAGGYLVIEEAQLGFGLGDADHLLLTDAGGAAIDEHAWTAVADMTTDGRCGDEFAVTRAPSKGAANLCGAAPPPAQVTQWPTAAAVTTVDPAGIFGGNLSDLFYERTAGGDVMWAVQNGPSRLYRLVETAGVWAPGGAGGWTAGKALRFPDGTGEVDAEGVTRAELDSTAIYVASERDNAHGGVSRLSILRYDTAAAGSTLVATHEWNVTGDLPAVFYNAGFEALTWVPDEFLVAHGFFDEAAGHTYMPSQYPGHGTGLFFAGLEANGEIYVYALDHDGGGAELVATIASGNDTVMSLAFDRDVGYLWAQCDNECGNLAGVLTLDGGRFGLRAQLARPATMANLNNEGVTFAPEAACVDGARRFFWSDDGATGGHSLRSDTIPCGAFVTP